MTLEDEEKDAMARWRPVLASVGACACFGLIIRSLIRCHTPAFHTAFCCLTRLTRDLGPEDGPVAEVMPLADVPTRVPHFTPLTPEEYAERIAARQRSVARRMLS